MAATATDLNSITFSNQLKFYLNGSQITLDGSSISPDVTLLSFIRSQGLTGTKLGCGEGGCGACTGMLHLIACLSHS